MTHTRVNIGYSSVITFLNCNDFRVVNIKFQASGGDLASRISGAVYPSGISMSVNAPCNDSLLLDCDVQGAGPQSIKVEGTGICYSGLHCKGWGKLWCNSLRKESTAAYIGMSMQDFANDKPEYTNEAFHTYC